MQLTITSFGPDMVAAHLIDVAGDGAVAYHVVAKDADGARVVDITPAEDHHPLLRLDPRQAWNLVRHIEDNLGDHGFADGDMSAHGDPFGDLVVCDRGRSELRLPYNDGRLLALALRAGLARTALLDAVPA